VALYNATNGSNWTNNDNWLSGPVSTWYGIEVSESRVVKIELMKNYLLGSIPVELGKLSNLTTLILKDNHLGSVPPTELGDLNKLSSLILGNNQLSDLMDLSALTSLTLVHLPNNEFTFGDFENSKLNFFSINYAFYDPQDVLPEPSR
jgi:Leucine-rich repeat (LRR) protein